MPTESLPLEIVADDQKELLISKEDEAIFNLSEISIDWITKTL